MNKKTETEWMSKTGRLEIILICILMFLILMLIILVNLPEEKINQIYKTEIVHKANRLFFRAVSKYFSEDPAVQRIVKICNEDRNCESENRIKDSWCYENKVICAYYELPFDYNSSRVGAGGFLSPSTLAETKAGICKDYAVAMHTILNNLNVPVFFEFSEDFGHVWVVAYEDGKIYELDSGELYRI